MEYTRYGCVFYSRQWCYYNITLTVTVSEDHRLAHEVQIQSCQEFFVEKRLKGMN